MVALRPAPAATYTTVELFGAGPGLYFDFATFNFQVPTSGSGVCAKAIVPTSTTADISNTRREILVILGASGGSAEHPMLPPCRSQSRLFGPERDQGIDARSSTGRQRRRQDGDCHEQCHRRADGQRINGRDAVQQTLDEASR